MKNSLKLDFDRPAIIMDRTFAAKAKDTNSDEYRHLQEVRRDYPDWKVITRTIKRNPNKETYKGLTYDYMENYILVPELPMPVISVLFLMITETLLIFLMKLKVLKN